MRPRWTPRQVLLCGMMTVAVGACGEPEPEPLDSAEEAALNDRLRKVLADRTFTGTIESQLEERLGRPIDTRLADVGRLLFFDPILSLTRDNSCSGCHGPNVSFNDSQPIAVGVGNNGIVGPGRVGPHNQRRAPTLLNAAFYPRLMWDSRFVAISHDPFRNHLGFAFPEPDGRDLSHMQHLLQAQAFTPVTNRVEMAGSFAGDHHEMRSEVVRRVDGIEEYRRRFSEVYPELAAGAPLTYEHIAEALAEFQFTLVRADAPIDAFARGDDAAMSVDQKRGALLFFGTRTLCGECHIVGLYANEMFSDFDPHVIGVPQLVPAETNVVFDGPGADEDFGYEQQTGTDFDRYKFRTSPLRNVAFQPSYMHNGAYVCLEDAVRHHLEAGTRIREYRPRGLGAFDARVGPREALLSRLHQFIENPADLTDEEVGQIVAFLRDALSDPGAAPDSLRSLIPETVPSGLPVHEFDFDVRLGGDC